MKHINLQDILQPEQKYVLEYSRAFNKDIYAVKHDLATDTCFEKAKLIGWKPEQVVKSVFLYDNFGKFYGFVAPELSFDEKNPLKFNDQLIKRIFSNDKKKRKSLMGLKNNAFPLGMERGTCTPFVPENYFELGDGFTGTLERIFVYDSPKMHGKKSDISIGGMGEEWHKISAHLNYEDIYGCLNWKFPEKIEKFSL